MEAAKRRLRAAFEFFTKLRVRRFTSITQMKSNPTKSLIL